MPMQPRPRAETSKLLFPSLRFCMAYTFLVELTVARRLPLVRAFVARGIFEGWNRSRAERAAVGRFPGSPVHKNPGALSGLYSTVYGEIRLRPSGIRHPASFPGLPAQRERDDADPGPERINFQGSRGCAVN